MWNLSKFRSLVCRVHEAVKNLLTARAREHGGLASGRYYHSGPEGPNAAIARRDEWKMMSYKVML